MILAELKPWIKEKNTRFPLPDCTLPIAHFGKEHQFLSGKQNMDIMSLKVITSQF